MAQSFLYHVTIHDFNYNGFHGINVKAINCAEAMEIAKKKFTEKIYPMEIEYEIIAIEIAN